MFVGSFALLILSGTVGMQLLPGIYTGEPMTWLDALFTCTSAVCVTGLIVKDTAQIFTPFGQGFVLLLIQLGGLGMLTFASLILVALGKRLSLRAEASSIVAAESALHLEGRNITLDIVRFTFLFESIGAILLYALWVPKLGWKGAAWPAIFHSVSAFCNAGFSTFTDNLMGFQRSPASLIVIACMILAGGLGFLTHTEMWYAVVSWRKKKAFRVSLQSRLVIFVTLLLTAAATPLFAVFEWNNCLTGLSPFDKLINSMFMSVTPRTAGFNAIDYGQATDSANLLTMMLMTVGGSPGSTAGGFKTTTLAILGLMAWSRLRGSESTNCVGRSIPEETTSRAVGLFVIAIGFAIAGVFLLSATENAASRGLTEHMFEVSSAVNTVGLSMGLTPKLSVAGRWVIILMMFLGRVGLLTLAALLTVPRSRAGRFRYAYEDVVIG
ncbi:MAG: potassium transporter TrkH [Fuerstia sp.]|nr:potassium transporter TrkH [Fuerstiella sp.]